MMRPAVLVPLLLLGGCSQGAEADLQSIGQARSLAAEWAMVNDQAAHGKVSQTYANVMRKDLRDQLQTAASSLTQPDSPYGQEIRAVLREPDDVQPDQLRAHADRLKQIENALESA